MKTKFLVLALFVSLFTYSQTEVHSQKVKLKKVNIGSKTDSLIVRGSDNILKTLPRSIFLNDYASQLWVQNQSYASLIGGNYFEGYQSLIGQFKINNTFNSSIPLVLQSNFDNSRIRFVNSNGVQNYLFGINSANIFEATTSLNVIGTTFSQKGQFGNTSNNAVLEVAASLGEVFRADAFGGAYRIVVHQTGVNFQGILDFKGASSFHNKIQSYVATGTAPLTVASTTKVDNLNVDKLDGLDSTDFALIQRIAISEDIDNGYSIIKDNNHLTVYNSDFFNVTHNATQEASFIEVKDDLKVVNSISAKLLKPNGSYTVATLPSGQTGQITYITDATTVTYRGIAAGGGTNFALVVFDGTNWIYH